MHSSRFMLHAIVALLFAALSVSVRPALAQAPFSNLPGYERYERQADRAAALMQEARIRRVHWCDDGSTLFFRRSNEYLRVDLETETLEIISESEFETPDAGSADRRRRVGRGGQRDREPSPCGKWVAVHRDWNVIVEPADDDGDREPILVTTDGERKHRYGKASWVYGEELRQTDAMWWSPDSRKLAYYEFDERDVPDYFLTAGNTRLRTEVLVEGYPKPGDPNPVAKLWLHDLETGSSTRVQTHQDDEERYIYRVQFSQRGDELIFHRTNRRQNVLELVAADAECGESRVILAEEQDTWQDNRPIIHFLNDGERFIWASERTGWKHFELWHIDGKRLATLTRGDFAVRNIEHVDEVRNVLFYSAYTDELPLNAHLHRVNLDGSKHRQLTEPGATHTVDISPDGRWFIERRETVTDPPVTRLRSTEDGREVAVLSTASPVAQTAETAELLTLTAADGETVLYGTLHKPSDFDPDRQYPLLVDVYGGPVVQRVRNTWRPINPYCEFGFIIASIDNRGTPNRGKEFESATYLQLGVVDLDDQAAAVTQLINRPYIDGSRVGIVGHSYGGYMAALAMVRFPGLFHAAVATSGVFDWRNYDTIYTERYMRTPEENPLGYDAGSVVKLAEHLEGDLLIQHGLLDDNVHPANAWQLIHALQEAGRPFELMIYPEHGHSLGNAARHLRWEFLHKHLIQEGTSGQSETPQSAAGSAALQH